ncbi:MAG: S8 family serine peptidase, partial [Polyangiales bacterium]
MPRVLLGAKHEPALELRSSPDHIVVRTRSRRPLQSGPVPPAAAAEVADGQVVLAFPEAGVEVFRVPASNDQTPAGRGPRSLDQRKVALRRDPDVQFAGGVLVDNAGEPVIYTENLFVKFEDTVDPEDGRAVLLAEGLTIKQELDYATNAFFVAAPEGTGQRVFEIAERLIARPDVEYCHPELVRRKRSRAIFPPQWHLQTATIGGRVINAHANVAAAHALSRGQGITIAIIDDGVDIDHPELKNKVVSPRDVTFAETHPQAFNPRPKDVYPQYPENHGTACAGVACAAGSDGASGVAPDAKLLPIRLASGLGSQQEAQ